MQPYTTFVVLHRSTSIIIVSTIGKVRRGKMIFDAQVTQRKCGRLEKRKEKVKSSWARWKGVGK